VVISNTLNNKSRLSDRPFDILQALFGIDYAKTVEFFVSTVSKQLPPRMVYDKRFVYIRNWLLNAFSRCPKKLPIDVIADGVEFLDS
jgi:hypothetical protein